MAPRRRGMGARRCTRANARHGRTPTTAVSPARRTALSVTTPPRSDDLLKSRTGPCSVIVTRDMVASAHPDAVRDATVDRHRTRTAAVDPRSSAASSFPSRSPSRARSASAPRTSGSGRAMHPPHVSPDPPIRLRSSALAAWSRPWIEVAGVPSDRETAHLRISRGQHAWGTGCLYRILNSHASAPVVGNSQPATVDDIVVHSPQIRLPRVEREKTIVDLTSGG